MRLAMRTWLICCGNILARRLPTSVRYGRARCRSSSLEGGRRGDTTWETFDLRRDVDFDQRRRPAADFTPAALARVVVRGDLQEVVARFFERRRCRRLAAERHVHSTTREHFIGRI